MARLALLAHLPRLRIESDDPRIGGRGILTKLPWEQYDQITMGAFSDWRARHESAEPVFYWTELDLDLPIVRDGPPPSSMVGELKVPRAAWDAFLPRLELGVIAGFHDRLVNDPDEAQRLQHAAWQEQRRNTQPWLVTDLVTVGSPLTYADFLVTAGRPELEEAMEDRMLPACPPVTETEAKTGHRRCSFTRPYRDDVGGATRTFTVFNHGAPFAVTRWTNLFFRTRWLGLVGDPVGGPVAPQLGRWVKDVPLDPPARRFTHTWYWRPTDGPAPHLAALRTAIAPEAGAELIHLATTTPAFVAAERTLNGV